MRIYGPQFLTREEIEIQFVVSYLEKLLIDKTFTVSLHLNDANKIVKQHRRDGLDIKS